MEERSHGAVVLIARDSGEKVRVEEMCETEFEFQRLGSGRREILPGKCSRFRCQEEVEDRGVVFVVCGSWSLRLGFEVLFHVSCCSSAAE